jgi:hypothetical protein
VLAENLKMIFLIRDSWPYLLNNRSEVQNAITNWFKETLLGVQKITDEQQER